MLAENWKIVNVIIPHLSAFLGNEVFHINELPKQTMPLLMLEFLLILAVIEKIF